MKNEIRSATGFLSNLLRCRNVAEDRIESFRTTLQDLLCDHYQNHWFPEKPFKGSGYRCIRINHKMDPLVRQAAVECGMSESDVHNLFPSELTMWVDPREVSYRFGENGSIGMLYESDLPHVISQKHKEKQSQLQQQQQEAINMPQHQVQSSPSMPSQADLEYNTLGYTCKDQLMSVLPNVSRDSLKQLAAFV